MKYRLYVSGFCDEPRRINGNIGIGGVILNNSEYKKIFSKKIGQGTALEANVYGILYGINEVIKDTEVPNLLVFNNNLLIVNYLNNHKGEMPLRVENLIKILQKTIDTSNIKIDYKYFEINEYSYVRNLAMDALKN